MRLLPVTGSSEVAARMMMRQSWTDGVERVGEQVGEDLAELAGDAEDVERVVHIAV